MRKFPKGYGIPLNNDKMPMPEDVFDLDFDERSEFFKHLMSLKMREESMSDEERTSPDTFGCDSLFLDCFITDAMRDDFSLIARDFLIHEYANINDHEMVEYLSLDIGDLWPEKLLERFILNLMMNAVNSGSEYARNLFLYLHKVYYRKEYRQLKKFSTLSGSELMALSSRPDRGMSPVTMARILVISRMSGIKIGLDCNFMYLFLNDYVKDMEEEEKRDWKIFEEVADLYKDSFDEVDSLFKDHDEMFDLYAKYNRFEVILLRSMGLDDDFIPLCNSDDDGLPRRLGRTLAVLRKTYKDREFTKEEIIQYSALYEAVSAAMCCMLDMKDKLGEVIYGERGTDFYENFPPFFKADEVQKGQTGTGGSTPKDKTVKKTDEVKEEGPQYKEETLLAEIDMLHRKIHEREGNIKGLRTDLAGYQKLVEENRQLREQIESEHKELAALREHVYGLTEDDREAQKSVPVDEMKSFLKDLRIIVIGGHSNWQQKMKQEFPNWTYIDATVSGTLDSSVVDKADRVYFFTDTISHSTYFKYMNVVKERNVDFGYIHGVNIENNIRQMYRELKK